MLALIRISVRDRPGMLGDVASNLGSAGADIVQVQVLEAESGRALDDVYLQVRDADHLQRACTALTALAGVQILGTKLGPPPTTGHTELELIRHLVDAPARALQTLVDGAPAAAGADWAAIVRYDDQHRVDAVVATSPRYPGPEALDVHVPLRLTTIETQYAGAALVPLTGTRLGLVVVRESGPAYHSAELWRLEQVGAIVGSVVRQSGAQVAELEVVEVRS